MKRDWELCRTILLEMEEHGEPFKIFARHDLCGCSEEQFGFHAYLLGQAGLVELAEGWAGMNSPWKHYPTNITWEGYEFIELIRDENTWKEALRKLKDKAGAVTFDLLKTALIEAVKLLPHLQVS